MTPKKKPPPVARTPKRGRPWPARVVKKAVERLEETRNATEAKKLLEKDFQFKPHPPARSTLIGWARKAEISLDNVDPHKRAATGSATAQRLENLAGDRAELAAVLVRELSRPAANLIAKRLEAAVETETLVKLATDRYRDALIFEAQVRGSYGEGSDEAKGARAGAEKSVREARTDLRLALELSMDTRDLVGIVTRSVNDHLALEGLALSDKGGGDLIVELAIPRPDRKAQDEQAIAEDELAQRREAKGAG